MDRIRKGLGIAIIAPVLLTGCWSNITASHAAIGGLAAAGLGAGTGAIIGSNISNGNVMKSTLLGAAIGLPIGIGLGLLYDRNSEPKRRELLEERIRENQQQIYDQQHQIDQARDDIQREIPHGAPYDSTPEHQYLGPSLGNAFR